MKMRKFFREKSLNASSSFTGVLGFLGGYQVCHNLCLGIITLLSVIGITIVGMPLLFLTKVAIPFWTTALVLFIISLFFYFKGKYISRNLLLLNSGIIIAGVPFNKIGDFLIIFWIIGGLIILLSIILLIKDKIRKRKLNEKEKHTLHRPK